MIQEVVYISKIGEPKQDYSIDFNNATGYLNFNDKNYNFYILNHIIYKRQENRIKLDPYPYSLASIVDNLNLNDFDIEKEIKIVKKFYSHKNCTCDDIYNFSRTHHFVENADNKHQFTFSKQDLLKFFQKYGNHSKIKMRIGKSDNFDYFRFIGRN